MAATMSSSAIILPSRLLTTATHLPGSEALEPDLAVDGVSIGGKIELIHHYFIALLIGLVESRNGRMDINGCASMNGDLVGLRPDERGH